ncbi:hypothetical protein HDU83_009629 [Entophlyctis luteolus]|nr:hypothetical protein HDU83_009629 [Entophlyctis luteolus]
MTTWSSLAQASFVQSQLLPATAKLGISAPPSIIQSKAFAPLLHGRSAVITAHTGTGKTLAFVAPLAARLSQIASEEIGGVSAAASHSRVCPRVLVLVPHSHLARQTLLTATAFPSISATLLPPPVGVPLPRELRTSAFAVSTPALLVAHLCPVTNSRRGAGTAVKSKLLERFLERTIAVVIDEADVILRDFTAAKVVSNLVAAARKVDESRKAIARNSKSDALKTAGPDNETSTSPFVARQIEPIQFIFVGATLSPARFGEGGKASKSDAKIISALVPEAVLIDDYSDTKSANRSPANLKHSFINVFESQSHAPEANSQFDDSDEEYQKKFDLLVEAIQAHSLQLHLRQLEDSAPTSNTPDQWLVFCNTKESAEILDTQLQQWQLSISNASDPRITAAINRVEFAHVHKDVPANEKSRLITRFAGAKSPLAPEATVPSDAQRRPLLQIMVATDMLSRGLDFPFVSRVFQFDCALSEAQYIHRAGRTARMGGYGHGEAVSYVGASDRQLMNVVSRFVNKQ